MYCPSCATHNEAQAVKCVKCAKPLPALTSFYVSAYSPSPFVPREAGFAARVGAWIIDAIIMALILGVVSFIPMTIWFMNFFAKYQSQLLPICEQRGQASSVRCNSAIRQILMGEGQLQTAAWLGFGTLVLALVLCLTYSIWLTKRGATIGKRVFGLRVVQANGNLPRFGQALLRQTVGYSLSSFFMLGFLWVIFDPYKQSWHDKIANTYVVHQK